MAKPSSASFPPKPLTAADAMLTLAAGAVTGMITKTAVAPLERTKVLFQLQGKGAISGPPKYTAVPQTLRLILAEEGFRGWYKGNGANCFRIVPVYALKFGFNDTFKGMLQKRDETGRLIPLSLGGLIIAGSMSGMLQCAVTYPLELVYTRLVMATTLGRYKGIIDCFLTTARTEGVGALYKGFGPSFVSAAPFVGLQMTGYEMFKRAAVYAAGGEEGSQPNLVSRMVAGSAAGLMAQTIMFPFDTVRKRMQVQGIGGAPRVYNNSFEAVRGIMSAEGVRGFFKGAGTNAVRAVPEAAIQFALYDFTRDLFLGWGGSSSHKG